MTTMSHSKRKCGCCGVEYDPSEQGRGRLCGHCAAREFYHPLTYRSRLVTNAREDARRWCADSERYEWPEKDAAAT